MGGGGGAWCLLQDDPDRYFHKSVRHGITYDMHERQNLTKKRKLPQAIFLGLNNATKRSAWNDPVPAHYALPTETWREHIARRQRYETIRAKLNAGEVTSINDLVTYNLDIQTFAQDVIAGSDDPELIRAFWRAVNSVSILDPTCGSGAFLFAALNILEPIYVACLEAMRGLLEDEGHSERNCHPEAMRDFGKVLDSVSEHVNERYFILKSIIVNNLFGVDIMDEAVEICKLRLFLKLVAQLESYDKIEPLPDIDFNVRAGNTLVGFASMHEIQRSLGTDLVKKLALPAIEERAERADRAFREFRKMQTDHGMSPSAATGAKSDLREQLAGLRAELDCYLASEFDVKSDDKEAYEGWRKSHLPFHWFVEFYGIMDGGGFDVIIGNPPYISVNKTRQIYAVRNFTCDRCPDIYAHVLERSQFLLRTDGRVGMIVPLSLGFSRDFDPCRRLLFSEYSDNWFSSFTRIPSGLFKFDVRINHTIHIGLKSKRSSNAHTTRLHRWYRAARPTLFQTLQYAPFQPALWQYRVPKLNSTTLAMAFEQLLRARSCTLKTVTSSHIAKHGLNYKNSAYNWLNYCRKVPPCYNTNLDLIPHTGFGHLYFKDFNSRELAMLLANGKLMLIFWFIVGDSYHVTQGNFTDFPADLNCLPRERADELLKMVPRLETAMQQAIQFKWNKGKKVGNYNLAKCRSITDRSDKIFCEALGLSDVWEDIELYYSQSVRTDFSVDDQ